MTKERFFATLPLASPDANHNKYLPTKREKAVSNPTEYRRLRPPDAGNLSHLPPPGKRAHLRLVTEAERRREEAERFENESDPHRLPMKRAERIFKENLSNLIGVALVPGSDEISRICCAGLSLIQALWMQTENASEQAKLLPLLKPYEATLTTAKKFRAAFQAELPETSIEAAGNILSAVQAFWISKCATRALPKAVDFEEKFMTLANRYKAGERNIPTAELFDFLLEIMAPRPRAA